MECIQLPFTHCYDNSSIEINVALIGICTFYLLRTPAPDLMLLNPRKFLTLSILRWL